MKVGERYRNISRDKRYIIEDLYKMQRNGVTGRNERKERGKERKREREREREREKEIVYSCFERREPGSKMSLWGI